MAHKARRPDVRVENHGTIFLLRPVTRRAKQWTRAHIDPDAQTFGGAIAVEHRFIDDIVQGLIADGLEVA